MESNTFGQFLRRVIEKRNLSAAKIAELTGNKSKTSVVRLLNDKSSPKTILKFAETLAEVIDLSEDEKECMNHIISENTASPARKTAMDNLLNLFKTNGGKRKYTENICMAYNSKPTDKKMSLNDLFNICLERESLIIIEDVVSEELVFALDNIIHETAMRKFSPVINQFFKFDDGIEAKGKQLLSVMKLSTYLSYNAYEVRHRFAMEKKIIILTFYENTIHMRLIEFAGANRFFCSDTEITEIFYKHLCYRQNLLKKHSLSLRSKPMKQEQFFETLKVMESYDAMPALQINSTPPYMFIPFDIQIRLFEDCNYIGFGKDHPFIQPIYNLIKSRAELIKNTPIARKMIFTLDGLKSFLKNGKTGDYFRPFDPLTPDECRRTLKNLINKDGIECKILKDDFSIYDTEFIVFGDRNIIIYDPIWGWWKESTYAELHNKRMAGLLADFYNEVLWKKCCYNKDESRKIMEDMIENKTIF